MKITITGSLGNIGKPLTEELVKKGHSVTVISSKPERQKEIKALSANGLLPEDYYRNKPILGKVKMEDFAKEFVQVYNQK